MSRLSKEFRDNPEIDAVVRECAARIEETIRRVVASRLDQAVQEALRSYSLGDRPAPVPSTRPKRMCPVPGCGLPAAGPKYAWRCRSHKEVSRAEIDRLRAEAFAPATEGGITRLPPGPGPDRPRRPGPPMDCRAPGCFTKSKGPRYDYFCGVHFSSLSPDERAAASRQWKEARERAKEQPPAEVVSVPSPVIRRRPAPVETPELASVTPASSDAAPESSATFVAFPVAAEQD